MKSFGSKKNIELWGGVECTVNRVGDNYYDQLKKNGHHNRLEDLDSFAELGISSIRYPVLWERVAPGKLEDANWSWADKRLARLRELNIHPIVGLLHHGSGPRHTSLVDPNFPDKFAEFAMKTAQRYPWIDAYTPINEPLTTARFSGLYGYWYPHGKNDCTFARALVGQCRATILAMKFIRQINPRAKLVQTEDLGKTYSTPLLEYQAEFENHRRWLTFDLLAGRVSREHPMWSFLRHAGISEFELEWFLENRCPPDILGFNYYLTSERFLDENIEKYPNLPVGGNGRERYVDVEAVRVNLRRPTGLKVLMQEAWERFKLPLAITEVHLGCTREEQLRWFSDVWQAANALRRRGVDLRAVAAWSLLGSFDWNSLLTSEQNHYESGVFDVSGGDRPRPTALARLLKTISSGQKYEHPALEGSGWWKSPARFIVQEGAIRQPLSKEESKKANRATNIKSAKAPEKSLLITGATGTLGQAFAHFCQIRGLSHALLTRREMDIGDQESIRLALEKYQPWAVVNTAGYARVDAAESEPEVCFRENTRGAANLAEVCGRKKISFMTFSSDLVFDGHKKLPYIESDLQNQLNIYGQRKADAEKQVLEINPKALVIRSAAFFSPQDDFNFLTVALRSLVSNQAFKAANDIIVSPTYLPDLVNACLDILVDGESGLWHLANQGELTWSDFARLAAKLAKLDSTLVLGCSTAELKLPAQRPVYSVLGSERSDLMPDLDDSVKKFVNLFKAQL